MLDKIVDLGNDGKIGFDDDAVGTRGLDLPQRFVRPLVVSAIIDCNVYSIVGQTDGDCLPDALTAAGHDRDFHDGVRLQEY